jgi:hypothetical protein
MLPGGLLGKFVGEHVSTVQIRKNHAQNVGHVLPWRKAQSAGAPGEMLQYCISVIRGFLGTGIDAVDGRCGLLHKVKLGPHNVKLSTP